ncbi:MAG: molybdopterin-dependent oxidoreductase [Candidatus Eremiobacteraeota bacterium]|nr:molybdopterin-dependent oxidoreductase [Candidatus Eremiobacteraeota bacterium]
MEITFTLNGTKRTFTTAPGEKVADLLRRHGFLSIRTDCDGQGTCGACAVILNGKKVCSCLLLPGQVEGGEILTLEGLAKGRELHPIQKAFLDAGAIQCGHCSPGMMLSVYELLSHNDNPDEEAIKDALSGNLCRCTGYAQFFDAIKRVKNQSVDTPSFRDDLRVIGKSHHKVDGPRLAKAAPSYVEDFVTDDALVVKVLRSPHAHARIKNIDTSAAEALPGVHLVVTHKNGPKVWYNTAGQGYPEPSPYDTRLVDEKVRYVGDRAALIAAESEAIADEAMKLIKVDYEVLPAVFTPWEAMKDGAPLVHDRDTSLDPLHIGQDPKKNLAAYNAGGIGDVGKGFREADVIIEREYQTSRVQCTPLETHRCFAYIENERLVIRASTQVPWHLRRICAKVLGIKENQIHVRKERVGGGYGAKQDIVLEDIVAWVTWQTGKPSYIKMTREEEFVTSRTRHPMYFKIKAGAKKDGTLTALDMTEVADTGAYGVHCLTVPMNACSKSLPLMKCDNMHFDVKAYYTNNPIAGAYQGYGAPQGSFALQMALAELADALGVDQVEFLKKNMVGKGFCLEILKSLGEGQEGIPQVISSCGLKECLERGAELIDWGRKVEQSKPWLRTGKGTVIIQQGSGLPGIDSANATVKMMGDGTFMILMGGTDLGTGLDTLATKICAETLCLDVSDFSLLAADTDTTPFDVGAYASSGTYFSGMAVYKAALAMKEKILDAVARHLNCDRAPLGLAYPGKVTGGPKEIPFAQVAHFTQGGSGEGQLIASASFTSDEAPIPYGAHFAQVTVDMRTGKVHVDRYFAIQECGTPINPELALGQVYGGTLKSIGHSLYEEMIMDEKGKCLNPDFLDYKLPMIRDLPGEFKAELIQVDDHLGPYGGKSTSEISTNGAAVALAVAIHNAAGVWIRDWPFTAEKIFKALREKESPAAREGARA